MRTFLLMCLLVPVMAVSAHARPLLADAVTAPQPLLPYCSWLADPEGKHTIESISDISEQENFAPLRDGIPVRGGGSVWLRLTVAKTAPGASGLPASTDRHRLSINMGDLPPGENRIYYSKAPGPVDTQGVWHSEQLFPHEDILLPEPGIIPVTVYVRMAQMPGLWFAPQVGAESAALPDLLPSELLLPGLLIAVFAALALRAVAERTFWALWSALLFVCALIMAVVPLPAATPAFSPAQLPALLAPGMLLMILPHVGRCLFRTHGASVVQDGLLYLCSLLGAVVVLAPLFPGMHWLTRLFPLWGLLLAPLLPLCLGALAQKRIGAPSFTAITVMPLVGACAALYALKHPDIHPLAYQGALWGLAVGGIALVLVRVPKDAPAVEAAAGQGADAGTLAFADGEADHERVFGDDPFDAPQPEKADPLHMDISTFANDPALAFTPLEPPFRAFSNTGDDTFNDLPEAPAYAEAPAVPEAAQPSGYGMEDEPAQQPEPALPFDAEQQPEAGDAVPAADVAPVAGEDFASPAAAQDPAVPEAPAAEGPLFNYVVLKSFSDDDAPAAPAEVPLNALSGTAVLHDTAEAPAGPVAGNGGDNSVVEPEGAYEAELPPDAFMASAEPEAFAEPETLAEPVEPFAAEVPAESAGEESAAGLDDEEEPILLEHTAALPVLPDFASSSDTGLEAEAAAGKVISLQDDDDFSSYPLALMEELQNRPVRQSAPSDGGFVFNLHSLVREVHDMVSPFAEAKGLLFSWFIAPTLPVLLEGDAPRLRGALSLLLQNSVQATSRGMVQLTIRKSPGAQSAGELLFTITDNGSAQRTDAGFFHAWELAAGSGGSFNVEYTPTGGTQISFMVRFALPSDEAAAAHAFDDGRDEPAASGSSEAVPVEEPRLAAMTPEEVLADQGFLEPAATEPAPRNADGPLAPASAPAEETEAAAAAVAGTPRRACLLAAEMTTSNRRLLAHYLADMPYEQMNVSSNKEVPEICRVKAVALVIFDGDTPEADIIGCIATLREMERESGTPPTAVLVLTGHETQARRMRSAGSTYTLAKPFGAPALRDIVEEVMPVFSAAETGTPVPPAGPVEEADAGQQPEASAAVDAVEPEPTAPETVFSGEEAPDVVGEPLDAAVQAEESAGGTPDAPVRESAQAGALDALPQDVVEGESLTDAFAAGESGSAGDAAAGEDGVDPVAEADTPAQETEEPAGDGEVPEDRVAAFLDRMTDPEPSAPSETETPGAAEPAEEDAEASSGTLFAARHTSSQLEAPDAGTGAPAAGQTASAARTDVLEEPQPSEAAIGINRWDDTLPLLTHTGEEKQERETDILEEALRDAPKPTGKPVLVSLPPRHLSSDSPPAGGRASVDAGGEDTAAPLIMGLSPQDVTPQQHREPIKITAASPVKRKAAAPAAFEAAPESSPAWGGTPPADPDKKGDMFDNAFPENAAAPEEEAGTAGPAPFESTFILDEPPAAAAQPENAGEPAAAQPEPAAGFEEAGMEAESAPESVLGSGTLLADTGNAEEQPETVPAVEEAAVEPAVQAKEAPQAGAALPPELFPLPGFEGEGLDATTLPLVPGIIHSLHDAMLDIQQGKADGQCLYVQEAAARLAGKAEHFYLNKLGKIARCVERAAEADDMEAVTTLLEDLQAVTTRYSIALKQAFDNFLQQDR